MKTSKAKGRSRARVGSTGGSASGLSTRDLNGLMHDAMLHQLLDEMGAPKEQSGGMLSPFGRLRRIAPELQADRKRLDWLCAYITDNGLNGMEKIAWTARDEDGKSLMHRKTVSEDEVDDIRFDREAIDAAMRGPNSKAEPQAQRNT